MDINKIGQALYGDEWKTPFANALGLNRKTMQRYANGEMIVNPNLKPEILKLIEDKIMALNNVKKNIDAGVNLPVIKSLVFVSAWADRRDRLIAVGDDVYLPVRDVIDDALESSANGHYEIKLIEPTPTLVKIATHSNFYCVDGGMDYYAANSNGKITAASQSYLQDQADWEQMALAEANDYKAEKKIERKIEALTKCYRLHPDDEFYLQAYFFNS